MAAAAYKTYPRPWSPVPASHPGPPAAVSQSSPSPSQSSDRPALRSCRCSPPARQKPYAPADKDSPAQAPQHPQCAGSAACPACAPSPPIPLPPPSCAFPSQLLSSRRPFLRRRLHHSTLRMRTLRGRHLLHPDPHLRRFTILRRRNLLRRFRRQRIISTQYLELHRPRHRHRRIHAAIPLLRLRLLRRQSRRQEPLRRLQISHQLHRSIPISAHPQPDIHVAFPRNLRLDAPPFHSNPH